MVTVSECAVEEQLAHLRKVAASRGWVLEEKSPTCFVLGMKARDGTWFWLLVDCDRYPTVPPAWNWMNRETGELNKRPDIPQGSGFFHSSSERICAPWNRIAYKSEDPKGPHNDWQLLAWMTNPKTRQCLTLAAMAIRIYVELRSPAFGGRMG